MTKLKLIIIFAVIILPIIACDCSDDVAKNPRQIALRIPFRGIVESKK